MTNRYQINLIRREFQGQAKDDYHAVVTRLDGKQLIFIADWKWLVKWRTRRKALDRAFRRSDKHDAKLSEVEWYTR